VLLGKGPYLKGYRHRRDLSPSLGRGVRGNYLSPREASPGAKPSSVTANSRCGPRSAPGLYVAPWVLRSALLLGAVKRGGAASLSGTILRAPPGGGPTGARLPLLSRGSSTGACVPNKRAPGPSFPITRCRPYLRLRSHRCLKDLSNTSDLKAHRHW
jgi:hypothetical protein